MDSDVSDYEARSHSVSFEGSTDGIRDNHGKSRSDSRSSITTTSGRSKSSHQPSSSSSSSFLPAGTRQQKEPDAQGGNGEARGRTKRKKYT
ncbi:hypothetical protein FKM82_019731 [Ascaphus truei]